MRDTIIKTKGTIYKDKVLSILNIENKFIKEFVIIQGIIDLLL